MTVYRTDDQRGDDRLNKTRASRVQEIGDEHEAGDAEHPGWDPATPPTEPEHDHPEQHGGGPHDDEPEGGGGRP